MVSTVALVCSNRPRPAVHSSRSSHGNQWWARDVFHAAGSDEKTVCGIDIADWLNIETRTVADALADDNFCKRCAAKIKSAPLTA